MKLTTISYERAPDDDASAKDESALGGDVQGGEAFGGQDWITQG
ncbi:MAG: hypothetical protein ETSY1_21725 [Candidatus Entotheonella factor]|uniref:Uncharacterized protein n=1 Tax=Entotheonella factor TaxID=1429438 RepID=W4LIB4_ENTF1|nr:MAG: hypothetical protein ETSY1_21725 [Candidatus Entotheonella factor]